MGNPKAFLTIHRQEAGYRPVHERINDFSEVEQTLNSSDRKRQASRCMDCGVPFCHWACPLGNRQPEWQDYLSKGRWREAYHVLQQTCDFPEFTGRICPALCEQSCVLKLSCGEPVTIRENEAAIVEAAFREGYIQPTPPTRKAHPARVAIIGSGPAGLVAANRLNRAGHDVTVFDKEERPGGLLRYGIPNFKLGKNIIDRRVRLMEQEGIAFRMNTLVGSDTSARELLSTFDAVCIAIGSEVPRDLPVEGRNLKGIHFALELLSQQNRLLEGADIPAKSRIDCRGKRVLVIGGGDTGSDCVGTANRQGALSVTQIEIMPKPPVGYNPETPWPQYPRVLKTSSSHEEGCTRRWCLTTNRFVGERGRLTGVEVEVPYHRRLISLVGIHSFHSVWQANAAGVDLNHNYNADWHMVIERPAPSKYGGPHPESEPETRAAVNFIRSSDIDMILAFHSQGREIYYDFDGMTAARSEEIAARMAKDSGYAVTVPKGTAVFGGCKDWFIKEFGREGFTIEIGRGKNPLPMKMLDEVYDENARLILAAMDEI